jgi:predicted RNase H-like HicB family nuclease
VYATGKTLEECRKNLKEIVEGCFITSFKKSLPIPKIKTQEIMLFDDKQRPYFSSRL